MEMGGILIDDSNLIHQMYRMVMARYKCDVIDANNGQDALDIVAVQDDIDLILLDINMPIMNGLQFLEKSAPLGIPKKIPIITSAPRERKKTRSVA
jgi:two-component system chemotaxis response regulator CheY